MASWPIPALPPWLRPFVSLSYPVPTPPKTDSFHNVTYYDIGLLDVCFIVTTIAVMAVLRDLVRLYLFEPFADLVLRRKLQRNAAKRPPSKGSPNGQAPTPRELRHLRRSVMRFAEQGWPALYYPFAWFLGLYIHYNLPTRVLNPVDVWIDYPHIPLAGPVKFYYLLQLSSYLHQSLILNAEARRKDHWQMMSHHIITVILIAGSYTYNFTRIGCLIMILMDASDIFLPIGKMMRYIQLPQIVSDTCFGFFVVSWIIPRHVLFFIVIYNTAYVFPKTVPFVWDPSVGSYITDGVYYMFISFLLALQALQLLWLVMILKLIHRVLSGSAAEDIRSDEDDDDKNS